MNLNGPLLAFLSALSCVIAFVAGWLAGRASGYRAQTRELRCYLHDYEEWHGLTKKNLAELRHRSEVIAGLREELRIERAYSEVLHNLTTGGDNADPS